MIEADDSVFAAKVGAKVGVNIAGEELRENGFIYENRADYIKRQQSLHPRQ
jgi:hypothetical protein